MTCYVRFLRLSRRVEHSRTVTRVQPNKFLWSVWWFGHSFIYSAKTFSHSSNRGAHEATVYRGSWVMGHGSPAEHQCVDENGEERGWESVDLVPVVPSQDVPASGNLCPYLPPKPGIPYLLGHGLVVSISKLSSRKIGWSSWLKGTDAMATHQVAADLRWSHGLCKSPSDPSARKSQAWGTDSWICLGHPHWVVDSKKKWQSKMHLSKCLHM